MHTWGQKEMELLCLWEISKRTVRFIQQYLPHMFIMTVQCSNKVFLYTNTLFQDKLKGAPEDPQRGEASPLQHLRSKFSP